MKEGDNEDAKWSENQLEGEDSERTVNCLRGRLLAERIASRNARDEAQHLGIKLIQLETLLKEERKSRNRAEKKLRFLINKLASMKIPYEDADISSVSSSSAKEPEKNDKSSSGSANLPQTDTQVNFPDFKTDSEINDQSVGQTPTVEDYSQRPSQLKINDYAVDDLSVDQDPDNNVDNSMALVSVNMPQETRTIDPEVLDGTVKEVLDALRRAKEQLLSSMERRRTNMIKVG